MVKDAYRKVKANRGSAGVDQVSIQRFEEDLPNNLYKLWNRLSSGSYFPPPVRMVSIPKANGKQRVLGIPTVGDRIAQEVIRSYLEPRLEEVFHENSYGYRPRKSAHQAIEQVRRNVRQYRWVIDLDIKSFFDEIDHELLLKALDRHVSERWVKMYIIRWLNAPSQDSQGNLQQKCGRGTPQGGVISPLLANLFLHYTLDKWLDITFDNLKFVRYADDVIVHCRTEKQAKMVKACIEQRLQTCKLRLNTAKTRLVHCRDYKRKREWGYPVAFDFLGFRFKPRPFKSRDGELLIGYDCAMSPKAMQRIAARWKSMEFHRWTTATLQDIATRVNPILRGIIVYYGKFKRHVMDSLFRLLHFRIVKWAVNKYKRFNGSFKRGFEWLLKVRKSFPSLFYHWHVGVTTN